MMRVCSYCKTETTVEESGVAICGGCINLRFLAYDQLGRADPESQITKVYSFLLQRLTDARERAKAASDVFAEAMRDVPSGIPHPDGPRRIHNVSRDLSYARQEVLMAHTRLNDFLIRGVVPEELENRRAVQ